MLYVTLWIGFSVLTYITILSMAMFSPSRERRLYWNNNKFIILAYLLFFGAVVVACADFPQSYVSDHWDQKYRRAGDSIQAVFIILGPKLSAAVMVLLGYGILVTNKQKKKPKK